MPSSYAFERGQSTGGWGTQRAPGAQRALRVRADVKAVLQDWHIKGSVSKTLWGDLPGLPIKS